MDNNDPSAQLYRTLRASITDALATRRPLLTHLNADTTWLLSLPYPIASQSPKNRAYFHILLDPWLRGGQSDVAPFFSQQWHKQPSIVQTIAEVEDAIQGIEEATRGTDIDTAANTIVDVVSLSSASTTKLDEPDDCWIDLVVISHEFTDHMHKETLLEISSRVPVLATTKAVSAIRSWRHFERVEDIPRFSGNWAESSKSPLPPFISISRLAYQGQDLLYYHSAVMVSFILAGDSQVEAVIYTPHGVTPRDLEPLITASPPVDTLALLHGLHDVTLSSKAQLNLGAHNGLKIQRILRAKYWVATHDEIKVGGGIVSWFLNRRTITVREALEKEGKEHNDQTGLDALSHVNFVEVSNGESLILE